MKLQQFLPLHVYLISFSFLLFLFQGSKTPETDSANGSASSDTDEPTETENHNESHHLVDCVCYTDIKFPNLLVFVIKNLEALVFRFDNLIELQRFYVNFSALKAVANQKAYNVSLGTKYNLLHRTDNNGVTHIEITREPEARVYLKNNNSSASVNLKTPENKTKSLNRPKDVNARQRNESLLLQNNQKKSASIENLLDDRDNNIDLIEVRSATLRKTWGSAEDLLTIVPKRPERRRRPKGRAPPPPPQQQQPKNDVLQGQFIRVNVNNERNVVKKESSRFSNSLSNILHNAKTKLTTYQQFKTASEIKRPLETATLSRNIKIFPENTWTNSVPRLLKKPRSRSETRSFTPMAYRYIDTTQNYDTFKPNYQTISNRLFGMSSKLKEFEAVQSSNDGRWKSLGELRVQKGEGSLKKKEDKRKKKVTFSAYTTVQVV